MLKNLFYFFAVSLLHYTTFAAEHDGENHGINWWGLGSKYSEAPAMGWYLITFIIFLAALYYAIKKPLNLYLEARSNDIRLAIDEAKIAKAKAEEQFAVYQARLMKLDDEIVQMNADFTKLGDQEKAIIKADADKIAAQIMKDAGAVIAAESERAEFNLKHAISREVIELATKELIKNMTPQIEAGLKEDFIKDLNKVVH